ncbi:MAG: hypothetical protein F6K63_04870 [Moorea sp. SIO1G6]|uniref:hypothetical protein n=1 Tax=Moorena sp. SIO1G6 TaxID=2607840 RepID=UPI0013C1F31B|nr:hypothetical protein [Moorena sp. SIO1G6]NET63764.1 hypothetical protein [Moorena sp. SIO1G6]
MLKLHKYSWQFIRQAFLVGICFYSFNSTLGNIVKADEVPSNNRTCTNNRVAQADSTNPSETEQSQAPAGIIDIDCRRDIRKIKSFLQNALNGVSDPLLDRGSTDTQIGTALRPGINADAILNVNVNNPAGGVTIPILSPGFRSPSAAPMMISFPGQLDALGNFTFNVMDPVVSSSMGGAHIGGLPDSVFTFNVGTTEFTANQSLDVRNNFVRAISDSPDENQTVFRMLGIVINPDDSSSVTSAGVTPESVPTGQVPIISLPGGVMRGSMPDR